MSKPVNTKQDFTSTSDQNLFANAWALLHPFITEERRNRLQQVADNRSTHIRLVLENIRDPHNVSACLRSADAFGVLNIDIVSADGFKTSTVAKGADNWLNVTKYQEPGPCIANLKREGYKIASAYPPHEEGATALAELPVDEPIAVVFGNEHAGVSSSWKNRVDYKFTIPMYGMVESLNISVSAAVTMQQLRKKIQNTREALLTEEEKTLLLNQWIVKQFKDPKLMLQKLMTQKSEPQEQQNSEQVLQDTLYSKESSCD